MGRDQVEIVREGFDAFNRGDVEAVLPLLDPDVEIIDPDRLGRTYRGRDGYQRFIQEWLENWDEYSSEPQELVANGDRVFVRATQSGRGKESGIEFSETHYQVFTLRDEKIVKYEIYSERGDAERAAGPSD